MEASAVQGGAPLCSRPRSGHGMGVAPAQDDHLEIRPLRVGDGLGHSGEPEEEEEVIVLEEPKSEEAGPKVVRVPRTPTQA